MLTEKILALEVSTVYDVEEGIKNMADFGRG
jgi:hypothetical protein